MDLIAAQLLGLFNKATCDPKRALETRAVSQQIISNMDEYNKVALALKCNIPGAFIGALHYREQTSLSLHAYLGNGQLIIGTGEKTTIQPLGRGPFKTFADGAIDACRKQGLQLVKEWNVAVMLEEAERWNGMGYRRLGVSNPYLFSGTSLYRSGKFVVDGQYSPTAVDRQLGVACILKDLIALGVLPNAPAMLKRSKLLDMLQAGQDGGMIHGRKQAKR